jgi:hypothetical protein
MRSRSHMGAMLALAALTAGAEVSALGAQRMLMPVPIIPQLASGGTPKKPGKHRNSGTGTKPRQRPNKFKSHCGAKQAASYAKQGQGINVHFERRIRWNETVYPRVLKHQALQRARARGFHHVDVRR